MIGSAAEYDAGRRQPEYTAAAQSEAAAAQATWRATPPLLRSTSPPLP